MAVASSAVVVGGVATRSVLVKSARHLSDSG